MYPGHNWILKFGKVVGNMRCVEKEFKLVPHKYEEYKEGCVSISVGRSLNEQDLRKNQVPEVSIESIGPKLVMRIFDEYVNILKYMYSTRFNGGSTRVGSSLETPRRSL